MSSTNENETIESYVFHHIDTAKCASCTSFSCEKKCFRGIYNVINKDSTPKCVVLEEREDMCVKCHMCTTACKYDAIIID